MINFVVQFFLMHLAEYLESTYLKTNIESNLSVKDNKQIAVNIIKEAIKYNFKLVMIRPRYVSDAKKIVAKYNSQVLIGTVIDFPSGDTDTLKKIKEAKSVILAGADELDFVTNYNAFKGKNFNLFDKDILEGTRLAFKHDKITKWIIETGALSRDEIFNISKRISDIINDNFLEYSKNVFIKTSTGYYGGSGATVKDIKTIRSAIRNLQIKASGGITNQKECIAMIEAGANRIGTSKALLIYNEK